MTPRFFTGAQVAAVAELHDVPMVVAHGLAADVVLGAAIRAEREREARRQWLALTGELLRKDEQELSTSGQLRTP